MKRILESQGAFEVNMGEPHVHSCGPNCENPACLVIERNRLRARVAELESFVSRIVANHTRSTECLMCERFGEQGADLLSAPEKEPTDE